MNPTYFHVVPPRTNMDAKTAPDLVITQDNWNDYNFQTLYHLSYFTTIKGVREETIIGTLKILRRGQTQSDTILVRENFAKLSQDFCSTGNSLDYYIRLRALGELGTHILRSLRDVVQMPELIDEFANEPGWSRSLYRDQRDSGANFRHLASGIVQGHYGTPPDDQQKFSFQMPRWQNSVNIDTRSESRGLFKTSILPERMNVLVGRNGSGKSTLLSRLARIAYASTSERLVPPLNELGTMLPAEVGFPRIVSIAFSPFDSFKLPGADARNVIQVAKDMHQGIGRFAFIGLRNFLSEADGRIADLPMTEFGEKPVDVDRVTQTRLKSITDLAADFKHYRLKISDDADRTSVLEQALSKLRVGLVSEEWDKGPVTGTSDEADEWFRQCSTGHKIAVLVVFGLVANLDNRSLVLFDEPETHLHPPLLSAMMHALRYVLQEYESSALVATHSPVVVQECLAKHIHVVRREGNSVAVRAISSETFGESIGLITAQVFGMESNATDFHHVLDELIKKYKSLEAIEILFLDGVMSNQARAYVISKLAGGGKQ
jgi:ABC-type lipoprotein export system ATPase subunit